MCIWINISIYGNSSWFAKLLLLMFCWVYPLWIFTADVISCGSIEAIIISICGLVIGVRRINICCRFGLICIREIIFRMKRWTICYYFICYGTANIFYYFIHGYHYNYNLINNIYAIFYSILFFSFYKWSIFKL